MKYFLFSLFFSLSAMAAEYHCRVRSLNLTFDSDGEMSSLIIRDVSTGQFYFNGPLTETNVSGALTELYFDTNASHSLQLLFKSSDLNDEADVLFGFIKGWTGAGYLDTGLRCQKKSL